MEDELTAPVTLFEREWTAKPISNPRLGKGFEIDFTQMYNSPLSTLGEQLSEFEFLRRIGEHFGTECVDVDEVSEGGCETCDYWSRYGYEIQVYNATKNVPEFK